MKAVKEIERKYYKYQYQEFVQPVLTANGTLGGSNFAVRDNYNTTVAFQAFDNSLTTAWFSSAVNGVDYLIFYNPIPLIVTNINCYNYQWITGKWEVYGSNDNTSYELLATGTNTLNTNGSNFDINLSSNTKAFKYYKINCLTNLANLRVGFGELTITATEQTVIDGTASNYDFYIDDNTYKLPREVDVKYFKTIYEQDVAGEYEVNIEKDGNYIVEMYGAGGGWASARWATDIWYGTTVGGGSGAGFKGIVNLTAGNYAITVGKAGENVQGGWNYEATGETGGSTSLNNLIIAGGGIGGYGYYGNATAGKGGSITIDPSVEVISDSINSTGNDGSIVGFAGSGDPHAVNGGASLYNGSQTGYGAGGGYPNNAVDGYIKIMQQTTEDDSTTSEIKYTYFAIGE